MAEQKRTKYRECSRCGRNRQEKFFRGTRGRVCKDCRKRKTRSYSKDRRLQDTYGLSLEEWESILMAQGGTCAICGGKRKTYDTDHDHKLEKKLKAKGTPDIIATRLSIRGLLCARCNRRLLPAALDSVDVLEAAIRYLQDPPAADIVDEVDHVIQGPGVG